MLTLEEIIKRLRLMNITKVSDETGIHKNTLYRIVKGESEPSHKVHMKLSEWLKGISS